MAPQKLVVPTVHVPAVQAVPPTQRFASHDHPAGQFEPQSRVPTQPSPITPQYWPPSGLHETNDTQLLSPPPPSNEKIWPPCDVPPVPVLLPAPPPEVDAPVPVSDRPGRLSLELQLLAAISATVVMSAVAASLRVEDKSRMARAFFAVLRHGLRSGHSGGMELAG